MSRPSLAPSAPSSQQSATTVLGSPTLLTDFDPLEIIGNGSFGIIRKVRRKADGEILARKELNFERMTERDRKQIVAEVNILKELKHDHIVRYHDRYVDREHGILYILMEYCGGGDLSGIIKQSRRLKQPVPEDTIWAYLTQLLHALHYCHHPGLLLPGPSAALSGEGGPICSREGKQVILHRDLKPENVFLDASGAIKLGDFGLSKAISTSSFANTYVGTPYYMSPELINDSPYDTKSDIWALGCLLYELCAWNPPFHQAQTHSELAIQIRSGRIPPLPKQYSSTLTSVIRTMLSLAPHARPSAQMLVTHEKIVHSHQLIEAQKVLGAVRARKLLVQQKEQQLSQREAVCAAREGEIAAEVTRLREEGARAMAQSQHLDALQTQFHAEVRAYQEEVTRFQQEVNAWREVQEREHKELVKARDDFNDTMTKAQAGFEGIVASAVEERAREIVVANGKEDFMRQMGELVRAEEREKAEAAIRAEWEAKMQAQAQTQPQGAARLWEGRPESVRRPMESRVPRKSISKRVLEELPSNILPFPSAAARHLAAMDIDTPTRPSSHGLPPVPLVRDTPTAASKLASKSMTNLSSAARNLRQSVSAASASAALETPVRGGGGQGSTAALEDQLARIAFSTSEGNDSPSVSSAKKAARRMTTSSAVPRPPLPTHANTFPTAIPIWNPDTLPPPPVWDMDDEENLPSPFIKKLAPKAKTSTGATSQAKKSLLAMAAAHSAAETKVPATGKEQQPPLPPATAAVGSAPKGSRLSMARAMKLGEENRQKLARRPL